MPTYQYRCSACGEELEKVQKFTDPALTTCEECGGDLHKVYGNVGIVFKGSGFYATDNRTKGKANAAAPASTDKADAKADKPAETKASPKTDSTPSSAPAKPAAS